jgi:hypothetical protein
MQHGQANNQQETCSREERPHRRRGEPKEGGGITHLGQKLVEAGRGSESFQEDLQEGDQKSDQESD